MCANGCATPPVSTLPEIHRRGWSLLRRPLVTKSSLPAGIAACLDLEKVLTPRRSCLHHIQENQLLTSSDLQKCSHLLHSDSPPSLLVPQAGPEFRIYEISSCMMTIILSSCDR